jgi:hypothetical protein
MGHKENPVTKLTFSTSIVFVLLMGLLCACTSKITAVNKPFDFNFGFSVATAYFADLPRPSSLKDISYVPAELVCHGADYVHLANYPQNKVASIGDLAVFSPNWINSSQSAEGLAYACYVFNMEDYDLAHQITFSWQAQGAAGSMWIGLADFTRDRWSWRVLPAGNLLAFDLTPYIDSITHRMLVLPLAIGTDEWQLASIHVGNGATLSGHVWQDDGVTPLPNTEIVVSGVQEYTTHVDTLGSWSIYGVVPGDYIITPYLLGWQFTPSSLNLTVDALEYTVADFNGASQVLHNASGVVITLGDGDPISGVQIDIQQQGSTHGGLAVLTGINGAWSADLPDGSYTATPSKALWYFIPASRDFNLIGSDQVVAQFDGTQQQPGAMLDGYVFLDGGTTPKSGVTIKAKPEDLSMGLYAQTDSNGYWSIDDVPDGSVRVTAMLDGWAFTPTQQTSTIEGADWHLEPFYATKLEKFTITGQIYGNDQITPLPDITVQIVNGSDYYFVMTGFTGTYMLMDVCAGTYTVTPQSSFYTFAPGSRTIILTENTTVDPFIATAKP